MTCQPHDWRPTGKEGRHVDFTISRGKSSHQHVIVWARYVRCAKCQQEGFRRPSRGSGELVYTWGKD